MTWVDYAVLAIIGISILLSIIHGFVRELLALASWIVAFLVAQSFSVDMVPWLPAALSNPSLRLLAAFVAIFVVVLILMTLLSIIISHFVKKVGLSGIDRVLGAVFGLLRGLVIVMVMVLLAGLTTLPKHPAWQHAISSAPLELLANAIKAWLPYDLSKHINYG